MKNIKLFEEFIAEASLSPKQKAAWELYYAHHDEHMGKRVADYHTSMSELYSDPGADLVTHLDADLARFKKQNKKYMAIHRKAIRTQKTAEPEFDKLNPGMEELKELIKLAGTHKGKSESDLLGHHSYGFAREYISSDDSFLKKWDGAVDEYIEAHEKHKKEAEKYFAELQSKISEL